MLTESRNHGYAENSIPPLKNVLLGGIINLSFAIATIKFNSLD